MPQLPSPGSTLRVVIIFVILVLVYVSVTVAPAGHVGVKDFFGSVSDHVLPAGIGLIVPGTRVVKFSVQTRELKEAAAVPTSEGLIVNLDVSLLFRVRPEAAARIYKTIGRSFERVIIDPQLRSAIRDVTAEYEAKFLLRQAGTGRAEHLQAHGERARPAWHRA